MVVNLVRSGRKQPQLFSASAGGQARHPISVLRSIAIAGLLAWSATVPAASGVALTAGSGEDTARLEAAWFRESEFPGWTLGTWRLTSRLEANLAYWRSHESNADNESIFEIGVTPVFRLAPGSGDYRFFAEAGIGAHLLSHTSISGREFGSAFQFGDLLGAGWRFGARREYELSLRIEHFSNAGIKQPNRGIEFAMLRIARRFPGIGT
jgi:lipid A 3-O-deacylase